MLGVACDECGLFVWFCESLEREVSARELPGIHRPQPVLAHHSKGDQFDFGVADVNDEQGAADGIRVTQEGGLEFGEDEAAGALRTNECARGLDAGPRAGHGGDIRVADQIAGGCAAGLIRQV